MVPRYHTLTPSQNKGPLVSLLVHFLLCTSPQAAFKLNQPEAPWFYDVKSLLCIDTASAVGFGRLRLYPPDLNLDEGDKSESEYNFNYPMQYSM
jgi:hypothetical protein